MSKFLIAGLGNIGAEYQGTRHNIGFDVIDAFVFKHGGNFKTDRLADVATIRLKGKIFLCIKPSTYMNLSGKAIKYWRDKEKIELAHILAIVDEIALPLSKIRLRPGGSDAGHNGLKSIHEMLGTTQYPRIRFGIGNVFPKGGQVDYVLGKWTSEELPSVKQKIEICVETIENFGLIGITATMNRVNNLEFGN
jgi:peptidyl-tRNA hydrolase, PTH1 family